MSEVTKPLVKDESFVAFKNLMQDVKNDIHTISVKMQPEFPLNSWAEFRQAIKMGYGPRLYPVGKDVQIGTDPLMTVVSHNSEKNPNDPSEPTCTLLAKKRILTLQFDGREAMYYSEDGLSAGTYWFAATAYSSWAAGAYHFTLTQALPAGGQFCIKADAGTALTSTKIQSFASQLSVTPIEEVDIVSGQEGTGLGTWATNVMNHPHRISYGSNNYKESAIRQVLNSEALAGEVWLPQTKFDRPPSWVSSERGFLGTLSEDMRNAIMAVDIGCRTNTVYEAPDSTCGGTSKQYTVRDKIFLASIQNVGFASESVGEQTNLWDYYIGATDADRIKLDSSGNAGSWWLRSPHPSNAYYVRIVRTAGSLIGSHAYDSYGVVPACVI